MTAQKTLSPQAWAELLLLSLIWGGSFLSIRIALDEIGPFTSVAHRVGWGALALWAYVLVRRLPVPKDPRIWGAFLVMGCLNNVLPFTLMAWGQVHIESGLTSILNGATVAAAGAAANEVRPTAPFPEVSSSTTSPEASVSNLPPTETAVESQLPRTSTRTRSNVDSGAGRSSGTPRQRSTRLSSGPSRCNSPGESNGTPPRKISSLLLGATCH